MKRFGLIVVVLGFLAVSLFVSFKSGSLSVSALGDGQPEATPEVTPVRAGRQVIAEGKVVPVRSAALSLPVSGIVAAVLVEEGDDVGGGDVLLRLEAARQRAAVAQAEAEVRRMEATLAEMKAGSREQEIESARAAVAAAEAQLQKIKEPAKQEDVIAAQAELEAAQVALQDVLEGPTEEERAIALAALRRAENELKQAQAAYDPVAYRGDVGLLPEALRLQNATVEYERAKAEYEKTVKTATRRDVSAAQARVAQAKATLFGLQRGASQAEIAAAEAEVRRAKAQLALLEAGQRPEAIAAAEANLMAARAALEQAEAALAETELRAPFAGTVAAVDVNGGELVTAGMTLVQVADLSAWRIETSDLTELEVVEIEQGDRALITVDALPGLELTGRVVRIKPLGENKLGDIVYTVLIEPDTQDSRLRWNMTTAVTLEPN